MKFMPGSTRILDIRKIGVKSLFIPLPFSCPRISWFMRVLPVWPQWSFQLWPHLCISPFRTDKALCPERGLHYYLDRTKDLRKGKDLVFVSFRKSFQKDIFPAAISSWIKQMVLLCYQLSDEESQNLHQVRAHDVRAFAASKAFQGGVSLDQILSACHSKAHNTFTQFYLKDVACSDSNIYHLGPVVAAQHVHE